MRALWLRVLLLAVFFNTAIGVPLHAATHLHAGAGHDHRQGLGHAHGASNCEEHAGSSAHAHGPDAAHGGAHEAGHEAVDPAPHGAHGSCTWCSSHAQLATALLAPAGFALPAAASATVRSPMAAQAAPAQAPRWRYAARAPPPVH